MKSQSPPTTRTWAIAIAICIIGTIADFITTYISITFPGAVEINPIMHLLIESLGTYGLFLGKSLPYSFWFAFCFWILRNRPEEGLGEYLVMATTFSGIAQMAIAAWNMSQIVVMG